MPAAGQNEAIAAALADAKRLPPDVRQSVRYLWEPKGFKETDLKVLAFQVNQLSRNPEMTPPAVVNVNLLRVNVLDYQGTTTLWADTWEKLAAIDPYFHLQVEVEETERWGVRDDQGKWKQTETRKTGKKSRQGLSAPWLAATAYAELTGLTGSTAPIVRADWWFVQTARQLSLTNKETGAGYYDWLGIKDRKTFEALIKLRVKDSEEFGREMRAVVDLSGISQNNRQIEYFQSLGGGSYRTLDVDDSTGEGNAVRNLKKGTYVHKAEEHYGFLPNSLWAFLANEADGDGKRQASVPDFIGSDDSIWNTSRDPRIHPNLGCNRCHSQESGLRTINDWARRRAKTISSPVYKEQAELRRLYFSNLNRQMERDRQLYREALMSCNGWTPQENVKHFSAYFDEYIKPVTAEKAAVELGVSLPMLQRTFANFPDGVLAQLGANPSEPIPRIYFEELFATAMGAIKR